MASSPSTISSPLHQRHFLASCRLSLPGEPGSRGEGDDCVPPGGQFTFPPALLTSGLWSCSANESFVFIKQVELNINQWPGVSVLGLTLEGEELTDLYIIINKTLFLPGLRSDVETWFSQ